MSETSKPTISPNEARQWRKIVETETARSDRYQRLFEEAVHAGLILRERLDQAEEFIEHMDMSYRWAEWLGEDETT